MNVGKMIFEVDMNDKKFNKKYEELTHRAEKGQEAINKTKENIKQLENQLAEYTKQNDEYYKKYEEILAMQAKASSETSYDKNIKSFQDMDPYEAFGKGIKLEVDDNADEVLTDYDEVIEKLDSEVKKSISSNYEKTLKALDAQKKKLEEQEYQYNLILKQIEEINQESDKQNRTAGKQIKLFNNLTKGVSKLAFGIIGAASAYNLIRKATNAYLQTDEHTTKQMQANWTAIGTFMEGIIKYVSSLMKKLVTSVLYFVSVLTGVNYIQKANTAILKQQEKATKDLTNANNKLTASFDEMEILNDTSSSATTPTVDTSVLFDVNDIGESARATIERIGNALKPVYETIKSIVDFCSSHPNIVGLMLGGAGLISLLTKIIGVGGTAAGAGAMGLAGVLSLLGYIAGFGVIAIEISILYSTVKEAKDAVDDLKDTIDKWEASYKSLNETRKKVIAEGKATPEWVKNETDAMKKNNDELRKKTQNILDARDKMNYFQVLISKITGEWDADTQQINANQKAMEYNLDAWGKMYEQGLLNDRQMDDYTQELYKYKDYLQKATDTSILHTGALTNNKETLKDAQKELKNTKDRLKEITGVSQENQEELKKATKKAKDYNDSLKNIKPNIKTTVAIDTTGAKNSLNGLFANIRTKISEWGIKFPTIKLAQGGIVNNPGRGVPITSNIVAGEAGPEAVLPLNDETMSMLAKFIADKMVINLTNVNQMNGRVISKELQRIKNEDDFAYNR